MQTIKKGHPARQVTFLGEPTFCSSSKWFAKFSYKSRFDTISSCEIAQKFCLDFKYSLRVNKKNILGEYLRSAKYMELFTPRMNKLNKNDLYWNNGQPLRVAWVGDLPF